MEEGCKGTSLEEVTSAKGVRRRDLVTMGNLMTGLPNVHLCLCGSEAVPEHRSLSGPWVLKLTLHDSGHKQHWTKTKSNFPKRSTLNLTIEFDSISSSLVSNQSHAKNQVRVHKSCGVWSTDSTLLTLRGQAVCTVL